jgi:hypothetical protein
MQTGRRRASCPPAGARQAADDRQWLEGELAVAVVGLRELPQEAFDEYMPIIMRCTSGLALAAQRPD